LSIYVMFFQFVEIRTYLLNIALCFGKDEDRKCFLTVFEYYHYRWKCSNFMEWFGISKRETRLRTFVLWLVQIQMMLFCFSCPVTDIRTPVYIFEQLCDVIHKVIINLLLCLISLLTAFKFSK